MVEAISSLASAFGLSASAGLNAYLPLLIVALAARFTPLIRLQPPFDVLTNGWVIGVLVVLLAIEVIADKVPVVDSINDTVQTVIRPAAGAILFASAGHAIAEVDPVLAMVCGVIVAGGIHVAKATVRPLVTASSAGIMNPVVSTVEDIVSAMTALLAILVPALLVLILLALGAWIVWRRSRRPRPAVEA